MISATANVKGVLMGLENLVHSVAQSVPKGLMDVASEVLRLSQMEVPHDEGELQNSGTAEEVNGTVMVGYHKVYAARLHEHPEYKFQKGRKGKYLEDPIVRNSEALGLNFGKSVQTRLF